MPNGQFHISTVCLTLRVSLVVYISRGQYRPLATSLLIRRSQRNGSDDITAMRDGVDKHDSESVTLWLSATILLEGLTNGKLIVRTTFKCRYPETS